MSDSENDVFGIETAKEPEACRIGTEVKFAFDLFPRKINIAEDSSGGCGGKTWEAATVLSNYLVHRWTEDKEFLKGLNVVELGSGTGIVGILAGLMMAASIDRETDAAAIQGKVYLTDMLFLELMQKNVDLNMTEKERKCVEVAELKWGTRPPARISNEPVHLILCADCVYLEAAFAPLLETLIELSSFGITEIFMVSKKRRKADKRFFDKLKKKFDVAEESPFLAVGCASQTNNLFIVENTCPQILDQFDSPSETSGLKIRSAFSVPDAIFKMSFSGDRLLTSGSGSRVQLFKIHLNELGTRGKGLEHLSECKLGSGKLSDINVAPPGTRVASVRVHDVDFMPSPKSTPSPKFIAAVGRKLFLWDIEHNKSVASEMVSYDQVTTCKWSPHPPFGSLIATAGVDHHLSVLDARLMGMDTEKSIVWKVERAHGGHNHPAITSVEFNPFIPYWLASAGEDSVVRVWDLRYLKNPAVKIEGHYQGIQSMAWSTTHAEILLTGSTDATFRAWCIDANTSTPLKPSRGMFVGSPATEWSDRTGSNTELSNPSVCVGAKAIAEVDSVDGFPVISASASLSHLSTFYTLTTAGTLTSLTLHPHLLQSTTPHTFPPTSTHEHKIETAIHARNLSTAYTSLVKLSQTSLREKRTFGTNEKAMIELCTARVGVDPKSWAIANRGGVSVSGTTLRKLVGGWKEEGKEGGAEMITRFRTELAEYSYFLPPRFGDFKTWYEIVPEKIKTDFERVVQQFRVLVEVGKKNWESVLKAEEGICKGIKNDPTSMEPDYLKLILESILPNDYTRALSFGFTLTSTVLSYCPPTTHPSLHDILALLLFPTVYESSTWTVDPSNMERRWVDGRGPKMRQVWVRGFLDEMEAGVKMQQKRQSRQNEAASGSAPETAKKVAALQTLLSDPQSVLRMLETEVKITKVLVTANSNTNEEIAENLMDIITGEDADETFACDTTSIDSLASPQPFTKTQLSNLKQQPPHMSTVSRASGDSSGTGGTGDSRATNLNMVGVKFAYRPTISATTNRLYMDCLVLTKRFEEYFVLCSEFCATYQSFEFPKSILRHAELTSLPKLKSHIETLHDKSTSLALDASKMQQASSAALGQIMAAATKPAREGLSLVVKIAVLLAQLVEAKVLEKEGVEIVARCVYGLTGMLGILSGSVFKILDQMEKMLGKLGSAGAYAR
ncbi:hypothetical protein HDU98_009785 [Podochytrium sp. JEL0797]|nr:hypothetical protein HDU98_009785 [Podochytrium sp. JEL0797]